MDGNVIALGEDLLPADGVPHAAGEAPGRIDRQERVEAVHLHPEGMGGVGHQTADGAQADNTQLLTLDFGAGKLRLAFFHQLGDFGTLALQGFGPFDGIDNFAGRDEHPGEDQLLDGVGVGAGGVEHHDAGFAAAVKRDIVDAGPSTGDGEQGLRQLRLVQGGGPHQNAVRFGDIVPDGISGTETLQAAGCDFIQGFDLHGTSLLISWLGIRYCRLQTAS